jgi:hypothetical protein
MSYKSLLAKFNQDHDPANCYDVYHIFITHFSSEFDGFMTFDKIECSHMIFSEGRVNTQ